jgi:DNA-binding NarL/FixJ family response regulator
VGDDALMLRAVRNDLQWCLLARARASRDATVPIDLACVEDLKAALPVAARDDLVGCVLDLNLREGGRRGGLIIAEEARRRDPFVPVVILTGQDPTVIGDSVGREMIPCVQKNGGSLRPVLAHFLDQVFAHAARRTERRSFTEDARAACLRGELSEPQLDYLVRHTRGELDKEIAHEGGIPMGTLNQRRTSVIRKLGARSMRSAVFAILRRAFWDL